VRSLCKRIGKAEATKPLLYKQLCLISSARSSYRTYEVCFSVRVSFQVKIKVM